MWSNSSGYGATARSDDASEIFIHTRARAATAYAGRCVGAGRAGRAATSRPQLSDKAHGDAGARQAGGLMGLRHLHDDGFFGTRQGNKGFE